MKNRSLVTLNLLLGLSTSLAAQRTITGSVSDEFNMPLPGVNIFAKDTQVGTVTDADGNYTSSLPEGARFLVFSFIGFAEREVAIGIADVIDVQMNSRFSFLEEVVVTGVVIGTPSTKLGFNVAKINEDRLKEVPGVNAAAALQGKVPGVTVFSAGSLPGSSPANCLECLSEYAVKVACTVLREERRPEPPDLPELQ